ncbi:hypothetical protein NM208_g3087 [Fusarium decemcellulare]|uniref:Uncharacterized protein n=1 Tax=Fusarium decemcellulare TaxID=57161 RepID=A0ACC1SQE4_9HYPO|nr:hypothetical protein NM208_g3087 [Fusarium decemcellulare]
MQLSWPRDGDRKRAVISRAARFVVDTRQSNIRRFLNSSTWDVSLSEELENGRNRARYLYTMKLPRPTYLSPTVLNGQELHLIGFFNESRSLILGPTDDEVLAQFILRIAFSDPSDATNPVLQGVFALASLQLQGSLKSFRHKLLVISSLEESINWLDEKTLLQNLMATMLLYHYEMKDIIGCPTDVLQLVVHTCRRAMVAKPSNLNYANAGVEQAIVLEQRISSEVGDYGPIHIQSEEPIDRNTMISDLHRLASLIYVNRAVHGVSGTEFSHRRLVREGVLLLTKMTTCQNAWPLFIIACEAVDDEQRLAVLDVFEQSRQDRRRRSSHIHIIQHMAQAVWNQHDLDVENRVNYLTILDAVIGGVPFMPSFA